MLFVLEMNVNLTTYRFPFVCLCVLCSKTYYPNTLSLYFYVSIDSNSASLKAANLKLNQYRKKKILVFDTDIEETQRKSHYPIYYRVLSKEKRTSNEEWSFKH